MPISNPSRLTESPAGYGQTGDLPTGDCKAGNLPAIRRWLLGLVATAWLAAVVACVPSPDPAPTTRPATETSVSKTPTSESMAAESMAAESMAAEVADAGIKNQTIPALQGAGHRSPFSGQMVRTTGIVTALGDQMFFVQDPAGDQDPSTSDGLCVLRRAASPAPEIASPAPEIGQRLQLTGSIEERIERHGDLSTTCLRLESSQILAGDAALPEPVRLGQGGRAIPNQVADDDGLQHYDPATGGLDFFESLEGMRVVVAGARVVGATDKRGEVVVVADDGIDASVLSSRGGLLRREGDDNPEALLLDGGLGIAAPTADVGQRLSRVEAVIDYGFGIYRLRLTAPLEVSGPSPPVETTLLGDDDRHLTVATFNVLNLAGTDPPEKYQRLAKQVVDGLGTPDILALQEIQDDNGAVDDGTVSAHTTYSRLIDAILQAGGPRYAVRQIDPVDKADGGQPGANIRVGFLFQEERIVAVDSPGTGDPKVQVEDALPRLRPSPARLADPAFTADKARGFAGTRKPLVAQFRFHDRDLFVINLHLNSKGGDDSVFGRVQPPVRRSEAQRLAQARAVGAWIEQQLAAAPDAFFLVLGDFNEHSARPPVEALVEIGLTDLIEQVPADDRYTFVYHGNAQVLDHVLVSPAVMAEVEPQIDIVHCCTDYAASRQASDHDPVIARLLFLE